MKKLITIIGLAVLVSVNTQAGLWEGVTDVGKTFYDAAPTNFAVVPYMTYAKDAPTKVGGGALLIYNVNNNVGLGVGLDWLGHFSQFSGNVTFKLPIHPLRWMSSTPGTFAYDLTATPFALTGLATPLSGSDSTVSTILGAGAFITVAHLGGGAIDLGGAYVKWSGAGAYSGGHEEIFLAYRKGF